MPDPVPQLRAKFAPDHRYANFGAALSELAIDDFRGIHGLSVALDFPVIAFSGVNGAGKSTVGQLAVCAYRKPAAAQEYQRYYVKDFFPKSVADPTPFGDDAKVVYRYQTDVVGTMQEVTVSRGAKEWTGYKRQPERHCFYVGFSLYIPKVERRDFSIYRSSKLELRDVRQLPEEIRNKVGKILNQPYDEVHFQGIGTATKEGELAMAGRYGATYSENNMGFGEGRVLYMVDLFENAPEQSLFVLEEPETSLHPDSQHRLARYLLDVANRRHHQIIMSTHSATMLAALPAASRRLIHRDVAGVTVHREISSAHARAVLSGGHERLDVLVEDDFAKVVLTEIVRVEDPQLLSMIRVEGIGSHTAVREGLRLLNRLRRPGVGFVDGDQGPAPEDGVSCLPGNAPPEEEVFSSPQVQAMLDGTYGINSAHLTVDDEDVDHHFYSKVVARATSHAPDAVSALCAREYAQACLTAEQRNAVVEFLRERIAD